MKTEVPVLLLIFNRPHKTKKVFQSIRNAKPSKLYVAADGPRSGLREERRKCEEARAVATRVDWDCEVKTLFRSENLGCKVAVSGAVDWFFEQEEMGIILEDDCLPDSSFFPFCEKLLRKYREEEKVMTISGNNFQPGRRTDNSYYFSKFMHCWGWATWKRAWRHFDLEMKDWPKLRNQNFLSELFSSARARKYWRNKFDGVYSGEIDSWAYIWSYVIWKERGLNILPEVNLVRNIGFGEESTHTRASDSDAANMPRGSISFPLEHPASIAPHKKADKYTQKHHFQTPLYQRAFQKLKKISGID